MVIKNLGIVIELIGWRVFVLFNLLGVLASVLELFVSSVLMSQLLGIENTYLNYSVLDDYFGYILVITAIFRLAFIYYSAKVPMKKVQEYVVQKWRQEVSVMNLNLDINESITTYSSRVNVFAKAIVYPGFSLSIAASSVVLMFIFSLIVFGWVNLFPIITIVLMYVVVNVSLKKVIARYSKTLNDSLNEQLGLLRELFPNLLQIYSVGLFTKYTNKYKKIYTDITNINADLIFFTQGPRIVIELSAILFLVFIASKLVNFNLAVSAAIIMRFIPLLQQFYRSMVNLNSNYDLGLNMKIAVFDDLRLPFDDIESIGDSTYEINGIHFSVKNQINFDMLNVIYGPSGVGKSTFVSSVAKHLIAEGRLDVVYIGQEPLVTLNMFQEVLNSQEEELLNFISDIPHGKEISILGANLSGGQKKRIAISYGLIKGSCGCLFLDEPDSGLDDKRINELVSILEIRRNKAIVMVTHNNAFSRAGNIINIYR